MKKYNFNHGSPSQLVDALNARIAELGGDVEACRASDVEAATDINAAEGDNPMEDRIADALDDLQEDFDYFAAGVEKLMRSGANAGNEALAIIENCRNAINEYIAQIAQTVEGL